MSDVFTALQEAPVVRPPAPRRRVVLYNPRAVFFTMPLGLLAVGSHLDPARYEAVIVDGRLEDDPLAAVLAACDGAACLGIGVLTGAPIRDALAVTRAVRAARPGLPVVWGGWHPSLFPEQCVAEAPVEAAVRGQGEAAFAEVVDRLADGALPAEVPGCTWRDRDGAVHDNPDRPLADMNRFRPHRYDLLAVERYFARKGRRQLDYVSSLGCPHRCAFCADPAVYGRRWTGLEPERVVREALELWKRYGYEDLSFQDETFFTQPERAAAIAEGFLESALPVSWAATLRADEGARLPDEVWDLCRRSGLRRVLIGVESGDRGIMDHMRKDIRPEQVFACAGQCQRHGLQAIFTFMVGFPGETPRSLRTSLDTASGLRKLSPRFQTPIFYYQPYPGGGTPRVLSPLHSGAGRVQPALPEEGAPSGTPAVSGGPAPGIHAAPPRSLAGWAEFDFIGQAGPALGPDLHRHVERFKFYQQLAWDPAPGWRAWLQRVARWRCRRHQFAFPVEMILSRRFHPPERLS